MNTRFLGLFAAAALMVACDGPQESASLKEAKAVHEQLTRISDELHDAIFDAMVPLEGQIDSAMVAGDTLMAAQLAKLEGKLDRIHVRFHDWSETVTEIPGQACSHDHSHDHQNVDVGLQGPNTDSKKPPSVDICDASHPIIEKSHRSTETSSIGWICWDGLEFDSKRLWCWLNVLSQLPGARRTKAVMRTNEGWWAFNFADKAQLVRPSGYRRDSRLEILIDGNDHPNTEELKTALLSCLTSIPKALTRPPD